MERSKYTLIFILLFFGVTNLRASYKSDIYNAYVWNNMKNWKTLIDQMNLIKNKNDFGRLGTIVDDAVIPAARLPK